MRHFKNTFFYTTSQIAASDSFTFPACSFIEKETSAKTFFYEFCKIFKNIFLQNTRMTVSCIYLKFFIQITYFIEHRWETASFMYKLQNFNHQVQWKVFQKCFFQALYTNTRRSYSEAFIYLKSLTITEAAVQRCS